MDNQSSNRQTVCIKYIEKQFEFGWFVGRESRVRCVWIFTAKICSVHNVKEKKFVDDPLYACVSVLCIKLLYLYMGLCGLSWYIDIKDIER